MAERILGVDLDNVVLDTASHMKQTLEVFYPGRFTGCNFESVDGQSEPEFEKVKMEYLRKPHFIPLVQLCDRVPYALSVFRGLFGAILINTNRWEDQREPIEFHLADKGVRKSIDSVYLRPVAGEHQTLAKVFVAGITKMNFVIEDDGSIAQIFADRGIKVILIDKPWNRRVPYHPNIKKYGGAIDFALDIIMHNEEPEEIFARHAFDPDYSVHSFRVQRVAIAEAAEIIIAHSAEPAPAYIVRPN